MSGVKATNCSVLRIRDSSFNTVGFDTGAVYHGLDIDSTNADIKIENVTVATVPRYGFVG